jgi:uncharacterized damage-inducible protein DinB
VNPLKIYDYLCASRERILEAAGDLPAEQRTRAFAIGLKTIDSTLAHLLISEWYYIERLEGRSVPPYEQWPIKYETPPAFEIIARTWREQSARVRQAIEREHNWNRDITWLSFPDDTRNNRRFHIRCTAGDLITQLALHEMHHRAQVMAMLREAGRPVQDIDYNDMMFERREASPTA